MRTATFAWCFSHGTMHSFPTGQPPWCTAQWVAFIASTEESALESKTAAYGDARFFEQLTPAQKLDVISARDSWDAAFADAATPQSDP